MSVPHNLDPGEKVKEQMERTSGVSWRKNVCSLSFSFPFFQKTWKTNPSSHHYPETEREEGGEGALITRDINREIVESVSISPLLSTRIESLPSLRSGMGEDGESV